MIAWTALLRVLLTSSLTRARLASLTVLGLLGILVGFAIGQSDPVSATQAGADLVNVYGLSLLAPIVTLVLASATLGDTVEDSTLMYLWLRPVPRWYIATAAVGAAAIAALPVIVLPLTVAALLTGGGTQLVLGAAISGSVAVAGYVGIFVTLGLLAKRALTWGIVYILIWEGFVARAGTSSSRFSVQYYARSILADIADVSLRIGEAPLASAVLVPLVILVCGIVATSVRLRHMSVA